MHYREVLKKLSTSKLSLLSFNKCLYKMINHVTYKMFVFIKKEM